MKAQSIFAISLVLFACVSRVLPHLANFSPLICVALFAGRYFDKRTAVLGLIFTLLISDILLGVVYHYPIFGTWTLFTYTGFLAILALGIRIPSLEQRFILSFVTLLGSSFGFWVWTNLSSWLTMYPKDLAGFIACYVAGIPFLQNSVIGTMAWFLAMWFVMRIGDIAWNGRKVILG